MRLSSRGSIGDLREHRWLDRPIPASSKCVPTCDHLRLRVRRIRRPDRLEGANVIALRRRCRRMPRLWADSQPGRGCSQSCSQDKTQPARFAEAGRTRNPAPAAETTRGGESFTGNSCWRRSRCLARRGLGYRRDSRGWLWWRVRSAGLPGGEGCECSHQGLDRAPASGNVDVLGIGRSCRWVGEEEVD